jgi:hypothetical protein
MAVKEQEKKVYQNVIDKLLILLKACPDVVKKGIGANAFAEDLIQSCFKLQAYDPDVVGAVNSFFPFISVCPQVFNSEIGIKAFLDELSKAALNFEKIIKKPERPDK